MKIACLGAARISPRAMIYPAKVLGTATLQAIAARDMSRAQAYAEKYDFNEAFSSYEEAIASDNVDLIYNALPNSHHAQWTISALKAGKHVICEKPLAMNVDEAKAVVDTAHATGKRVIEAFHCRYHPAYEQCLSWLDEGKVGQVRHIDAHFNVAISFKDGEEIRHRPETGGGAMMDLGCYPLHWVLSIYKQAATTIQAKAELNSLGVDESLSAEMNFDNGQTAKISTSMAQHHAFDSHLSIIGDGGRIDFNNPLAPHQGAELSLTNDSGTHTAEISPISTYCYQLDRILRAIKNNTPLPTENEAILLQQAMLDRVYEAAGLAKLRAM